MKILTMLSLFLASGSYAMADSCAADPDCSYVAPDSPALQTKDGVQAPGMYYADTNRVYVGDSLSDECKRRIYDHEQYHRQQHAQGRLVGREFDAELEAQQNAPVYNCGRRGPNGTLNNYAPKPWR